MLRRLVFAATLVYWSQRSYFQIQAIVFQCSLVIIYAGYVQPYETRTANRMELVNEAFTTVCSYFFFIFSGFVDNAETRYSCGWVLIGLVSLLTLLNLSVICVISVRLVLYRCRLRIKRGRNIREAIKRKQQIESLKQAEIAGAQSQEKFSEAKGFSLAAEENATEHMFIEDLLQGDTGRHLDNEGIK